MKTITDGVERRERRKRRSQDGRRRFILGAELRPFRHQGKAAFGMAPRVTLSHLAPPPQQHPDQYYVLLPFVNDYCLLLLIPALMRALTVSHLHGGVSSA